MTEKELKKLKRKQLLELLLQQTERADRLQEQLDRVQKQMRNKYLTAAEVGSIAEAALKLGGVFEAADAAAALYLKSAKKLEEDARQEAQQLLADTREACRRMEGETLKNMRILLDRAEEAAPTVPAAPQEPEAPRGRRGRRNR